jgi:hypothetical protein
MLFVWGSRVIRWVQARESDQITNELFFLALGEFSQALSLFRRIVTVSLIDLHLFKKAPKRAIIK